MASRFLRIVWRPFEIYRGFTLYGTVLVTPIYAVRVGVHTKASLDLKVIRAYVDEHWKIRLN